MKDLPTTNNTESTKSEDQFFPEYERSGKTALIAEMVNIAIGDHEILISAASRTVLLKTVQALDPSIDWSDLKSNKVRIAFVEAKV